MLEALDLSLELPKTEYKRRLPQLQYRLHRLQRACWEARLATVIVFEGWDAAGKGTAISKLTQRLEPRGFSLHAIREPRTFETHLPWLWRHWFKVPTWGEIAIFDRSWYGRVLVQRVEGTTPEERWRRAYADIVSFEHTLADSGTILLKYWFSVSDEEQERRFQQRSKDPRRRWKLSPMDIESRSKWEEYSRAKDRMFDYTDIKQAPWLVVDADDKKRARLNCINHIVNNIKYQNILPDPIELPPRVPGTGYIRPPFDEQTFVPEKY